MQMTGNTVLITGGGSGIGRALAEAFQKLGNQVIIAGRRKGLLDAATAESPGMKSAVLDVQDPAKLKTFAVEIASKFPSIVFGWRRNKASQNTTSNFEASTIL